MAFFNFISLKYKELDNQINDYIKLLYKKSDENFSAASPFGQILSVLKEFYRHTILYQKNIVRNLDMETLTNKKVIRAYSVISGNNPTRAITSTGTLKLTPKMGVTFGNNDSNNTIIIKDKTVMTNRVNGLNYIMKFGRSSERFDISEGVSFYVNIVQGRYETQVFTGSGVQNQIYTVNVPTLAEIDNFDIEVTYNGRFITIKDSLYDLLRYEYSCFVRTGLNGGIDIYFGNGVSGFIPKQGSIIEVTYLLTDGSKGNMISSSMNDFMFITEVENGNGNTINMNKMFDIICEDGFSFGSDGESLLSLKAGMSNVSRNFVLSTPSQYIFHLSRLGFFSKINVYNTLSDNNYTNDNMVYLFLIPKVQNYYNSGVNYFNLPVDIYYLDYYEINKITTYLKKLGSIPNGTELEVIQPVISRYVMFIYVRKKSGYSDDEVKNNIINSVSDYLTNLYRDDRIVRSEVISLIDSLYGVDGINVSFVSEKNEILHREKPNTKEIRGLDNTLGDIVIERQELGLIRGGWSDRNGTYYTENSDGNTLGPINIIFVSEL